MTAGRIRNLLLSYATAGFSKSVSAAVQIIALPVVATSLGAERFGALMVLGALGAAFCMPARGIPPSLSIAIAHCRGEKDADGVASQISAAAFVSAAMGAVALAIAIGLIALFGLPLLLGTSADTNSMDFNGAVAAFLLLIVATYGFAWVEGVRTGYEQHHLNNLFSLAGSVLALLGIALAWAFAPTLTAFFLAIYVVYPVVQLANLFLARRVIPNFGSTLSRATIRSIARRSFSWSVAQAGIVLNMQGTVWLAAQTAGLAAGGLVGAVIRFFQLLSNVFLALLTPVLPTLRHSIASGDRSWASRAPRAAAMIIGGTLTILGLIVALFGESLLRLWLGLNFQVSPIIFAGFGLLAIASMAPQLFYLVSMALGSSKAASINLLLGGICGTAFGVVAMQPFGLAGLIWGQALGMFFIACIPNTYLLLRSLRLQASPAVKSRDNFPGGRISR